MPVSLQVTSSPFYALAPTPYGQFWCFKSPSYDSYSGASASIALHPTSQWVSCSVRSTMIVYVAAFTQKTASHCSLPLPLDACLQQDPNLDLGSSFVLHLAPWRLPQAGYYCPGESTTMATPVVCGSPTVFCPEGSIKPVPVNAGYYSVGGGSDGTTRSSQVSVEVEGCRQGANILT